MHQHHTHCRLGDNGGSGEPTLVVRTHASAFAMRTSSVVAVVAAEIVEAERQHDDGRACDDERRQQRQQRLAVVAELAAVVEQPVVAVAAAVVVAAAAAMMSFGACTNLQFETIVNSKPDILGCGTHAEHTCHCPPHHYSKPRHQNNPAKPKPRTEACTATR